MVEGNGPRGGDRGDRWHDPDDYRYFGPFGAGPGDSGQGSEVSPDRTDPDQTSPLSIGRWSYGDEETRLLAPASPEQTQILPAAPSGSAFGATSALPANPPRSPGAAGPLFPAPSWPTPAGHSPTWPSPAGPAPTPKRRRRPLGAATIVLLSALTALVIGAAAGYGGSRLAERTASAPASSTTAPTPGTLPSASTPGASRAPVGPPPAQLNTVNVAKTVLPSTVMIRVGTESSGATGSGFVLDTAGHIMTNNHVAAAAGDGGPIQVVYSDGRRVSATLVGRSPSYDLAIIKVAASDQLRPIQIGDSDAVAVGESVIAVGSPLGLPGTVTEGIVSARNRPVVVNASANADSPTAYINAVQTDAAINPGNSGGPLIDAGARVIGVNSAILTLGASRGESGSIGLGFAIPINQAMEIGDLLIKTGKATYPVIGATVSGASSGDGVQLSSVEVGGPAASAGLRQGDVITSIDGEVVRDSEQLIVTIRTHRPGERVNLAFHRGQSRDEAAVTLGSKEG